MMTLRRRSTSLTSSRSPGTTTCDNIKNVITEITLPDGKKAEVRRLTECSAYVVPFTTRKDQRTGKRRRFYETGYHISAEYEGIKNDH